MQKAVLAWGTLDILRAYSGRGIVGPYDEVRGIRWDLCPASTRESRQAMSSRMARLVFGFLPARIGDFGDTCVAQAVPTPVATAATPLLSQLRQKLLSDEALAEHLQGGNAEALTVLFERHSPLLFGIARRILRNGAEAEDAVQQVFLDVFRSIQQFDPQKGEFKTWLLMFGYQRILNCRRTLVSNRFFETDTLDELPPGLLPEPKCAAGYSPAESSILVEQVLNCLQPRQRRTIELIYYEGLTAEEVSTRTGETVRVVRHNLYRGLKKLRRVLHKGESSARAEEGPR
jgi:RNA polymerase sigma-70 factor (ECF subfamily)